MTLQDSVVMLCCVDWFSRHLVVKLFPLLFRVVCHTFVWLRSVLVRTNFVSISVSSLFSSPTCQANLVAATVGIGHSCHTLELVAICLCVAGKQYQELLGVLVGL